MAKKKTFLILDGNSLLHRAWHAIPPLTDKDGKVVNAVYGFTNVIEKMLEQYRPDYMAVAWDLPGATFRHEEFEEYKATRKKKEQELYDQIEIIQDVLTLYDIVSLSAEGLEADDVLGTLAKKYGPKKEVKAIILTGDLDALQLVDRDVEVEVFIKGLSETKTYDEKAVEERYGLKPDQLIDLKALMGDSSDNIPGLAGVGQKTATSLLQKFGSIVGIYKAIEQGQVPEKFAKKFVGQEEHVAKMKRLVTIVENADLEGFKINDAILGERNKTELISMFRDLGFRRLLAKYDRSENSKSAPKKTRARRTSKRQTVDALSDLKSNQLAVVIKVGQLDLFGGTVRSVTLSDGKKTFVQDQPSKTDLRDVLEVLNKAELVLGHDLKRVMHHLGAITAPVYDIMIAAYLLQPGSRNFDLESIVYDQLGKTIKSDLNASKQLEFILELQPVLMDGLKKEKMTKLAEEIEMPLIRVLYEMESVGIEIDPKKLKSLSVEFGKQLEGLTKKIYKLAGKEFNINSPAQLADILFDELELPTKRIKKTKTGYSTAASELEKLWEEHKIIPLISDYREFAKLKSTYVDALPSLVGEDGRIHTSYNQTVTATGRLSSSEPNLQNIPIKSKFGQEIRKAFVAEKGKMLVAADYSQIELRLAAHIAKDKAFIKAFKDGADIHARTAAEVLGKKEAEVTKSERSAAKAINFGILYGMGPRHLARSTGFSRQEAVAFLDKYFEVHPGISQYIDEVKVKAHEDEYAESLYGRRRYLPDINSGVQMLVAAAERMAMNMPVQGTSADIMKVAMIQVADWVRVKHPNTKVLMQVHDELVLEVESKDVDVVAKKLKSLMEEVREFVVPLIVDVEVGKNWGSMKPWEK